MELPKIDRMQNEGSPSFRAEHYEIDGSKAPVVFSRRDFYKIWLINNKGILKLADQLIHISSPALLFLNPLIPYSFEPIVENRTGYWCIFTGDFLSDVTHVDFNSSYSVFNINNTGIFFPDYKRLSVISFLLEQIVIDFNSNYDAKYESIKHKIALLIHEGNKMQPFFGEGKKRTAAARITNSFINLLEKQYPITSPLEPLRLKKPGDFAGELAVHVNHLNAVVHEVTGKSTKDHIAGRMISESKALLRYSDWSVADIAYGLGFDYPNHFATFFKKHTAATPIAFRK